MSSTSGDDRRGDDRLTVVVVHWNRAAHCLRSLERLDAQGAPVRALVVDNGSRPAELDLLRSGLPAWAEVLELGRNAGFGPAANAGFRRWLAEGAGEWVGLMPHDAMPDEGTLAELLAVAAARPRLGFVSADVGDGATPVVDPYFGGITRPPSVESGFEPADHPHGTLMLARRRALEDVGLFDERYFAYCEEADLGLRALAAGWEVGLVRGAMVRNPEMGPGSAAVAYLQLRNTLLLVREHSGRYHAAIRLLVALAQITRSLVDARARDHLHHPSARLWAIVDFLRGRLGPPPARLQPS
ncbi:glycosyltransferase family 2 protein [Actinomarinicola tropica]|uniref:glycosyltransferase family 2 protein n=1 Tax=Actinomarinicola tropica TaxID=2789776 RepID=UPI0038992E85